MKKTLTLTTLLISLCSVLPAKDIHIESDGSGDYADIQTAVYFAEPNDRILLGEGTFRENVELKTNCPLDIIGQGVDKTTVKGYDRNAKGTATFRMDDATSVSLENMLITNSYYGVRIENSTGIDVKNNLVIGNGDTNIQCLWSNNCEIDGNTIDGNSIYGNTDYGLYYLDGNKVTITNNIIVNQQRQGFYCPENTSDALISFNNVWNNTEGDIVILDYSTTPTLISNISEDPLFRNRLNADYELISNETPVLQGLRTQSIRSPMIDVGTSDGKNPDGFTDIGAHNKYGRLERTITAVKNWMGYK